jgi:hypothetical protein
LPKPPTGKKLLVRLLATALAIAATALGAGCGTTQRAKDARAVAERFQTGLDRDDGAAACAELSEETSEALEQQEGSPCEKAILDLELPAGTELGDADVDVTSAAVSLLEGGTLFLDEGPAGWEISAAGCTPTAPDLPFDCTLEN